MEKLDNHGLTEQQYLAQYNVAKYEKPGVAIDNLLFAIEEVESDNIRKLPQKRLQVLLVKRAEHPFIGLWSLPGTFLKLSETFEEASLRCLKIKSQVEDVYLEQLYSFGAVKRDPRHRIISIAYMGLINKNHYDHMAISENAAWFTVLDGQLADAGDLAFDHAEIIKYGLSRLKNKLEYSDIAFSLLPGQFTLAELQQVYELILGKSFSKSNFQRKIRDKVECLNEYQKSAFRPALLYKYRPRTNGY